MQIRGPVPPIYAVGFVLCPVHSALGYLQARLTRGGDFHLIAKAHVALDHLTRHADIVRDLIDVLPAGAAIWPESKWVC